MNRFLEIMSVILFAFFILQISCNMQTDDDKPEAKIIPPMLELVPIPGDYNITIEWNDKFTDPDYDKRRIYITITDNETEKQKSIDEKIATQNTAGTHIFTFSSDNYIVDRKYYAQLEWKENNVTIKSDKYYFKTIAGTYAPNIFDIEYDHQADLYLTEVYDIFLIKDFWQKLTYAFDREPGAAQIEFEITKDQAEYSDTDEIPLFVEAIDRDLIPEYQLACYQTNEGGNDFLHDGHLIVIKNDLRNIDIPPPAEILTGLSLQGPGRGGWSVIFWNAMQSDNHRIKTTIHELGHQRSGLSELCEDRSSHDAIDCVMGQDIVASCTGANLINNPRFCGICESTLRSTEYKYK